MTTGVPPAGPKPVVNAALKRPAPPRSGGGGGAVLVALVAFLVAASSAFVAVYALNVAREAKSSAASAASAAERAGHPSASTTRAPAPAATTAAPTPTPTPTPAYVTDLRSAELTVPPTANCVSQFVDVDTATTGVFNGHDFYFTSCLGPLTVHLDEVAAGAATGPDPTPEACASQLAGVSPTPEVTLAVTQGLTFCLLTSKEAAIRQNQPQRLAVIKIDQVAADRTVVLALTTYHLAG